MTQNSTLEKTIEANIKKLQKNTADYEKRFADYESGFKELGKLKFTLDGNGNAVAGNLDEVVDNFLAAELQINTKGLDRSAVRGAIESKIGFKEGVEYLTGETKRLIEERFMPELLGITPLNTLGMKEETLQEIAKAKIDQKTLDGTLSQFKLSKERKEEIRSEVLERVVS